MTIHAADQRLYKIYTMVYTLVSRETPPASFLNDDSMYYVYTVYTISDKRKLNIKKIRSFPGCGSHFNVY